MKNGFIVLICLVPFALVVAYGVYESSECMSKLKAEIIYKLALDKESDGKLEEAYSLFKQIDIYACENYELRGKTFNKAVSLSKKSGQ